MAKNQEKVTSTPASTSTTTPVVDPKERLKQLAAERKALREQVKAANEEAKASRKEASKEVTLRWINNFTQRINRLQAKIVKAQEARQGLITRAKENKWIS